MVGAFSIEEPDDNDNESPKAVPLLLRSPIQCVFVFRRPMQLTDRIIQAMSGPFAHVDLLVLTEHKPADSPSFTTYMGESFAMSIRSKNNYNNKQYVGLHLEMMPDEAYGVFTYVMKLAELAVTYNFSDLLYQPVKSVLRDSVLFNDVPSEEPGQLQKVFCSQAFVLALRNNLKHGRLLRLCDALRWQNSRLIAPSDLYTLLLPYCRPVDLRAVRDGRLVHTD
eukprot:762433-Hanusia_phi.AAC.11